MTGTVRLSRQHSPRKRLGLHTKSSPGLRDNSSPRWRERRARRVCTQSRFSRGAIPRLAAYRAWCGSGPSAPRRAPNRIRGGHRSNGSPPSTPPSIARGYADLVTITHKLAEVAADSPIPSVLRSLVRQDAAHARDATIVGNLVLMVKEGSIMVRGLLRWVLKALAADPSHARYMRAAAGDTAQLEALSVALVRETLRLNESRYLYRTARDDVMIGRFRIPKGWLIRLCIGEAHENPRHFPDPRRFDPSRFMGSPPRPDQYCPFGAGAHACLGEDITLAIAGGFAREAALGLDAALRERWPDVAHQPPTGDSGVPRPNSA